jgi:hypothetical protein
MATDQRQQFYAMAANFAVNIRSLSLQMIIKIYLRNQRYQEAIEASLMALNDQTINDKRMFALYVAVARGLQEDDKFLKDSSDFKQLFQNGTEEFVFHPWAYFIQPGKELYL